MGVEHKRKLDLPREKERVAIDEKRYKGIRKRKAGRWVAEIRVPKKRTRIWIGSYTTSIAAAHAYDTAAFHLYGFSAKVNFPEKVFQDGNGSDSVGGDVPMELIRQKAQEVGARVDAELRSEITSESIPDLNKSPEAGSA